MTSAVAPVLAMLLAIMLVVGVIVADLLRVVEEHEMVEDEEEGVRALSSKRGLASCHAFVMRVFPVAAFKIVVVVWQIITQVCLTSGF